MHTAEGVDAAGEVWYNCCTTTILPPNVVRPEACSTRAGLERRER